MSCYLVGTDKIKDFVYILYIRFCVYIYIFDFWYNSFFQDFCELNVLTLIIPFRNASVTIVLIYKYT